MILLVIFGRKVYYFKALPGLKPETYYNNFSKHILTHIHNQTNPYKSKKIIGEYMILNFYDSSPENIIFGSIQLNMNIDYKDFNSKLTDHSVNYYKRHNNSENLDDLNPKTLDLGCGVGKSIFKLAKYFKEVTRIDYFKSYICNTLKEEGNFEYEYKIKGNLYKFATATVSNIDKSRITFMH